MSTQAASLFEQFWSHYPARNGRPKVGKQPCLLLFRELEESEQAECVQAAKHYAKASKPKADGSFTPEARDPIRFLKQDWWRDWVQGRAVVCNFRMTPACSSTVVEGTETCDYHTAYREKLARVRGA